MSRPTSLHAARGAPNSRTPTTPTRQRQPSHVLSSPMINRLPTPLGTGSRSAHRASAAAADGEALHRDHSLISFEWPVQGLEALRLNPEEADEEYGGQDRAPLPALLSGGVTVGEGWYKLDMARTIPPPHTPSTPPGQIAAALSEPSKSGSELDTIPISLYITSPTLDAAPLSYSFTSSILVGLRPVSPNIGERDSYTRWLWHTSAEHEFTKDAEYATVALPNLHELETMPSATLCVQIGSPASPKPGFTPPAQVVAPVSLIRGLSDLLDSATGDVEFICLEHANDESRKRVLRAHSEILRARSEYFKSLLDGGFKEGEGKGRVTVDDADYTTVYWLLHYVYCNELLFSADEDVRHVMNRLHLDRREVQRVLAGRKRLWSPGEWDYRVIPLEGDEQDLSTSVSLSEADPSERAKSISSASAGRSPPLKPVENRIPSALVSSVTSRRLGAASARPGSASGPGPSTPTPTPKKPPIPVAVPSGKSSSPNSSHPRGKHIPLRLSDAHTVDPHPHPSPQPPPASPLSVYMLAHRYRLDVLESLAKERILTGMTVDNCMPMLFATHAYTELHNEALDYVVDNFGSVQLSPEFQVCIKEVSNGVWGETGGEVLVGLFRRL